MNATCEMRRSALKSASTHYSAFRYLLVAGDREAQTNSIAVRTRDGRDLGAMPVEQFAERLAAEVAQHDNHQCDNDHLED